MSVDYALALLGASAILFFAAAGLILLLLEWGRR